MSGPPMPDASVVVIPQGDDDLHAVLRQLEELLPSLIRLDDLPEDDQAALGPASAVLAGREAADVAGTLAIAADPDRPRAFQPLVGGAEVMPLAFLTLGRPDVDRLVGAVQALIDPAVTDDIRDAVTESALTVDQLGRLGRLLRVDHGEDVATMRSATAGAVGRTVLVGPEVDAYQAITGRVLEVWHHGDPLMRFLYRG